MYWYINSIYQYITVCTGTSKYRPVHASMYKYIRVHTRTHCSLPFLKKVQTDLEPAILCITRPEFTPVLWATDLNAAVQVKVRKNVSLYIIWFCQTPCQCTWRLMTN